jgi:hypothetical protein
MGGRKSNGRDVTEIGVSFLESISKLNPGIIGGGIYFNSREAS